MTDCLKTDRGPMAEKTSPSGYLLVPTVMQCKLKERNSNQGGVSMKSFTGAHSEMELHEKL